MIRLKSLKQFHKILSLLPPKKHIKFISEITFPKYSIFLPHYAAALEYHNVMAMDV